MGEEIDGGWVERAAAELHGSRAEHGWAARGAAATGLGVDGEKIEDENELELGTSASRI